MTKKSILKAKTREKIFIYAVLFFPIIQFIVMYIAVNFNSILLAFQEYRGGELEFTGFNNFKRVFTEMFSSGDELGVSVKNSLIVFGVTFVLGFPLNMLFSFYIFKRKFFSKTLRFFMFLPSIVSSMIMSLVFLKFTEGALPSIFRSMGIDIPVLLKEKSTALGTIIFYMMLTGFSSNLILYPNAMSSVSPEALESASIDGASELQELLYILIPSIWPTITTFVVANVATIFTASGPLYAFYNFNAPPFTRNTGYFLFVTTLSSDGATAYPYAAASGIILTIVSVPITLFVKWIMEKVDPTEE